MEFRLQIGSQCEVCQQPIDAEQRRTTAIVADLFGAVKFAVCIGCGQEPIDHTDRHYRRRYNRRLRIMKANQTKEKLQ